MKEILFSKNFNHFLSVKYKDSSTIPSGDDYEDYKVFAPKFTQELLFPDESTFIKEYGNPLFGLVKEYCLICLEEYDNKISLKLFYGYKKRKPGNYYFQVSRNVDFLTVNLENGDVFYGYIQNYQKKRKNIKYIRKNYFSNSPLNTLTRKAKNLISNLSYGRNGSEVVNQVTELFLDRLLDYKRNPNITREENLIKYHFDKKGIKYPNNFKVFIPHFFGKEFRKTLKKNNNKLVESFMSFHNLQGKKIKKFLHLAQNLNVLLYKSARNFFGDNWLNQDGDVILKILNSQTPFENLNYNIKNLFSDVEFKRVYKTFKKSFIDNEINSYTFLDHIKMYEKLKNYGEDIKWMSDGRDYQSFNKEHLDWNDKLDYYRKGSYKRIYPDYFYKNIEIEIDGFFPVILDETKIYNEESLMQSNCVKNYIGRASSFVLSLRKGSRDSDVRATIEYRIHKDSDGNIECQRCQSLGKFNSVLESFWGEPLLKLDEKVLSSFTNELFETVKIKKTCLKGIELTSDSKFDENGHLVWTYGKNSNYLQEEW